MTIEEYSRFERTSSTRHEYVAGEVYALSGGTLRHNFIIGTMFARLVAAEGDGPCRVVMSDMRLEADRDRYYYPDVAIYCTPAAELDVIARKPCVVVEVTSPGTARIDRGEKLHAYQRIPSLLTYLIVDHRRRRVERHWRRATSDDWQREEIAGDAPSPIPIPCLGTHLTLDEIYRRVDLPAVGEPDAPGYDAPGYDAPDYDASDYDPDDGGSTD